MWQLIDEWLGLRADPRGIGILQMIGRGVVVSSPRSSWSVSPTSGLSRKKPRRSHPSPHPRLSPLAFHQRLRASHPTIAAGFVLVGLHRLLG